MPANCVAQIRSPLEGRHSTSGFAAESTTGEIHGGRIFSAGACIEADSFPSTRVRSPTLASQSTDESLGQRLVVVV